MFVGRRTATKKEREPESDVFGGPSFTEEMKKPEKKKEKKKKGKKKPYSPFGGESLTEDLL